MILINGLEVVVVGMLVVGLLVKFGMRWRHSPEELGYLWLRQRAAALGVDLDRIPDPAWRAIVDMSVASARDRALRSRARLDEANLAGALEAEALEISNFVNGSPCNRHSLATQILTEYRV
jgi:hypothetical protein